MSPSLGGGGERRGYASLVRQGYQGIGLIIFNTIKQTCHKYITLVFQVLQRKITEYFMKLFKSEVE